MNWKVFFMVLFISTLTMAEDAPEADPSDDAVITEAEPPPDAASASESPAMPSTGNNGTSSHPEVHDDASAPEHYGIYGSPGNLNPYVYGVFPEGYQAPTASGYGPPLEGYGVPSGPVGGSPVEGVNGDTMDNANDDTKDIPDDKVPAEEESDSDIEQILPEPIRNAVDDNGAAVDTYVPSYIGGYASGGY